MVFRGAIQSGNESVKTRPGFVEQAKLISQSYLFGKKQTETVPVLVVEQAPETKLKYKLRGIYFSAEERLSSAIVEIKPNNTNAYRLNDELDENIKLASIEQEYILINRYGKLERLNLEKPAALGDGQTAGSGFNSGLSGSLGTTTLLRSYKRRYVSNPLALAKRFQAIPVQANGRNVGFRLKALRGESLLKRLNFQDSDVFTKINGIGLDKPFQALDALKSLTTANSVTVTILRNGNEETMNFTL